MQFFLLMIANNITTFNAHKQILAKMSFKLHPQSLPFFKSYFG